MFHNSREVQSWVGDKDFMYFLCPFRINQSHLSPSHLISRRVGLKVEGSNFTLEGSPFLILAGTIHYFRVPREYWRDRLLKLKACGFNTVTTHVPWNLHEPMKGQFHFTGNLDFMAFISMASEVGLWVILCPGPYIGCDLDLGGLPSWLLRDPNMRLRTTYKGFRKAVNRYFDQLIPRIEFLQYTKGGPIIAVQIENEYGSYQQDRKYMSFIKKTQGSWVLATVHLKDMKKTYEDLFAVQVEAVSEVRVQVEIEIDRAAWVLGFGSKMCPNGLTHSEAGFGRWLNRGSETVDFGPVLMKDVREMFKLRFSLNFYMFHGGSNFGFMGGAEPSDDGYLPAVASSGKCFPFPSRPAQAALLRAAPRTVPGTARLFGCDYVLGIEDFDVPKTLPLEHASKAVYKSVTLLHFMSLWEILPYLDQPSTFAKPVSMEQLSVNAGSGQSCGYILYETTIVRGGFLTSRGHVQDRGQVFLNEKYLGVLDHSTDELYIEKKPEEIRGRAVSISEVLADILLGFRGAHILRILVENQGRLAYGPDISKERKGLTGDIYLDDSPLRKFTIYSLEMKTAFMQRKLPSLWKPVTKEVRGPAFFLAFLRVGDFPQDTFIKLEGWKKGVIFINGRNLGRYWDVGPQEALYLPGPWLHPGSNDIILFEEWAPGQQIQFTKEPFLGMAF
ncbi:beta-galactosidase-1-like protein 2 [Erethizon dorsatum]